VLNEIPVQDGQIAVASVSTVADYTTHFREPIQEVIPRTHSPPATTAPHRQDTQPRRRDGHPG
jgi:hypothetical protein